MSDEYDLEIVDEPRRDVLNLCDMHLGIATGLNTATGVTGIRALIRLIGEVVNGDDGHVEATYLLPFDMLRETGELLIAYSDAYDRGEIKPS